MCYGKGLVERAFLFPLLTTFSLRQGEVFSSEIRTLNGKGYPLLSVVPFGIRIAHQYFGLNTWMQLMKPLIYIYTHRTVVPAFERFSAFPKLTSALRSPHHRVELQNLSSSDTILVITHPRCND